MEKKKKPHYHSASEAGRHCKITPSIILYIAHFGQPECLSAKLQLVDVNNKRAKYINNKEFREIQSKLTTLPSKRIKWPYSDSKDTTDSWNSRIRKVLKDFYLGDEISKVLE